MEASFHFQLQDGSGTPVQAGLFPGPTPAVLPVDASQATPVLRTEANGRVLRVPWIRSKNKDGNIFKAYHLQIV